MRAKWNFSKDRDNVVHYIIVRKDLPFGTTLAMVSHAAANSIIDLISSELVIKVANPLTTVVLGVDNQAALKRLSKRLAWRDVRHTVVKEPDAPYKNAWMALGIWPGEREDLEPFFTRVQTYRWFEGPVQKIRG